MEENVKPYLKDDAILRRINPQNNSFDLHMIIHDSVGVGGFSNVVARHGVIQK